MSETLALLAHDRPDAPLAWRAGACISAAQFLADVARLAAMLPAGAHVLNLCTDRYRFAVGLAASVLRGKVSLLPPTYVPAVIRELRTFAPDVICLSDDPASDIDLPTVQCPRDFAPLRDPWRVPAIDAERRVAWVFTSGSTGTPVAHAKTWGRLMRNVAAEAERMDLGRGRRAVLVATVPPQHMYGFESSLLVALVAGASFCAERPFYPADVAGVLAGVPAPRILVSTPVHLRAILAAALPLPPVALIVSATAPLDAALAAEVEQRCAAPLLEIYGSTETGQIASRRPTASAEWRLWPGVQLELRDGSAWAQGGHLEAPTPLGDRIELTRPGHFLLHGRTADLVNVAGKRSSLRHLNHALTSVPGVLDGEFHLPAPGPDGSAGATPRLAAVAVAPGLTVEAILRALRERIDPVFLPRPLRLVAALPRNSTGKLPRALLASLLAGAPADAPSTPLPIAADHPAFAGHFPGAPIVPGVVLLDEALRAIAAATGDPTGASLEGCRLANVKFRQVVRPGEPVTLRFAGFPPGPIRFELESQGHGVASGTLILRHAPPDGR